MKIYAFALALLVVPALCAPAVAQYAEPTPTPNPNPLVYDDPAMHYEAPPGAKLVGAIQYIPVQSLSQDPTPVATWLVGGSTNPVAISIVMESDQGNLDGFDSTYENNLRADDPATLIRNKARVQLANGMPAIFLEITQGAGFTTTKIFSYIWIDSQRAVVLSAAARLGSLTMEQAQRLLAGATAVRYPTDQP